MKHLKMVSLVCMMSLGVLASAVPASATELYSGVTTLKAGTTIDMSLAGTSTETSTEGTVTDTCTGGTIKGKTTTNGSSTSTIGLSIESWTWSGCAEPRSTLATGTMEIHYTSGLNGVLTAGSPSFEYTENTTIFGDCVFTVAPGGTIGTITGSTTGDAKLDVNATLTRVSGVCANSLKWVGTYNITSPTPFHVTAS